MTNIKVLSPDDALHVDRAQFEREARAQFGPDATVLSIDDGRSGVQVTVQVKRPGESYFQIFYSPDVIFTDGTAEQAAEVVLWARALQPDDPGGRIWMVDEGFTGHVELVPDMSPEMLRDGWVDHDEQPPAY